MVVCSQSCQYEFQSLEQVMACSVPWHKSCLTCASCKKVRGPWNCSGGFRLRALSESDSVVCNSTPRAILVILFSRWTAPTCAIKLSRMASRSGRPPSVLALLFHHQSHHLIGSVLQVLLRQGVWPERLWLWRWCWYTANDRCVTVDFARAKSQHRN